MSIQPVGEVIIPTFDLADRMRKAREITGLDQSEFAEEIGISRASVSNHERGISKPRTIVLRAWALRSGVPIEWIETGKAPVAVCARRDSNPRPSL